MIVLDTTVLIYAVGADHRFREPCRQLIDAASTGGIDATTSVEAIQEFVHVRARRRDRRDAADLGRLYAELLAPLLEIGQDQLVRGLEIYERTAHVGAFDAVLAAAAMNVGTLVSADSAFAEVPGLDSVVPDQAGVAELLAPS